MVNHQALPVAKVLSLAIDIAGEIQGFEDSTYGRNASFSHSYHQGTQRQHLVEESSSHDFSNDHSGHSYSKEEENESRGLHLLSREKSTKTVVRKENLFDWTNKEDSKTSTLRISPPVSPYWDLWASETNWGYIGIFLCLSSRCATTLGLILYRKGDYIFGAILRFIGQCVLMPAALSLCPMSLIALLQPTALVFSSLLSPLILGEKLEAHHQWSSLWIGVGCVVAATWGRRETVADGILSPDTIVGNFKNPIFLLVSGVTLTSILTSIALNENLRVLLRQTWNLERNGHLPKQDSDEKRPVAEPEPEDAESTPRGRGSQVHQDDTSITSTRVVPWEQVLLQGVSAICGTLTSICIKCLAGVWAYRKLHGSDSQEIGLFFAWLLVGIVCSGCLGFVMLSVAAERFPSLTVVCVDNALSVVVQALLGITFFQEHWRFTYASAIGTTAAMCLNLLGVYILFTASSGSSIGGSNTTEADAEGLCLGGDVDMSKISCKEDSISKLEEDG
ncbi:unnamed protein product [Amoebophrya sp. A25]|nr:unnamed protein product [Amoebophrya sp. A25]|eukprot:GSA25T00003107001.1